MNTYTAFFKGKRMEVQADTSLAAQRIAAAAFRARKAYDVTVVLTAKGDDPVIVTLDN